VSEMSGQIRLFTSNRLEVLLENLAGVFAEAPPAPLDKETIIVESPGMGRWLSLRLAERFGVWANADFPFPNKALDDAFRRSLTQPASSALFQPEVLTWRIMALLDELEGVPGAHVPAAYLHDDPEGLKRYQLASRLADLFDQYTVYRPEMILAWEAGREKPEESWQADLWRRLCEVPGPMHRTAMLQEFLSRAARGDLAASRLPRRLSIFGIPTLSPMHLALFQALAGYCEVNLFLLNPSREYWGDILSAREAARRQRQLSFEGFAPHDLHLDAGHPLLASLGALGRDFFRLLLDRAEFKEEAADFVVPGTETLLRALQDDILNLRDRGSTRVSRLQIADGDDSLQVHDCHSPMREMEVLHDRLLDLFSRQEELSPADVLVMTPDIEKYAPFIAAVFEGAGPGAPRIPYSVADRSPRSQSPVVEAFLKLLSLPGSRLGVTAILDILETEAVMRRFELADPDLEPIRSWIKQARIRWGRDAADRADHQLPAFAENSWRAGLDRLLLGYAMDAGGEQLFAGILPLEQIRGSEAAVLGRFLDFVEQLFGILERLTQPRTILHWAEDLERIVDLFFAPTEENAWELQLVLGALSGLREQARQADFADPVSLAVIGDLLIRRLEREQGGIGFLGGGVTFCALLPMRSIPFRVVALVGMDDGAFPRIERPPGFDLRAGDHRPGDRSQRDLDRYLFLEALLSARDHLHISYVGQSIRDDSQAPPCVLVSELLDVADRGFYAAGAEPLRSQLVVRHRLQAFHPAYFAGQGSLFSYSANDLAAVQARLHERRSVPPLLANPLPQPAEEERTLTIRELLRFFAAPAREFLQRRLGIRLDAGDRALEEREAFEVEGLEAYALRQELTRRALADEAPETVFEIVRARGELPPGRPGELAFREFAGEARAFAATVSPLLGEQPQAIEIDLVLRGFRICGMIEGWGPQGPVRYRCATLRGKDLLQGWIEHLLACAAGQQSPLVLVGRKGGWSFAPLAQKKAEDHLNELLALFWQGLSRPLPLLPAASLAFAEALEKGLDSDAALEKALFAWEGNEFFSGEGRDGYLELAFRDGAPFGEEFCSLARQVYLPLLAQRKKLSP